MKTKNNFDFFIPHKYKPEYEFIEKYLTPNDILLEWGASNSTIYNSGLVKQIISIEHEINKVKHIQMTIEGYNIQNIIIHHVPSNLPLPIPCRYEQFRDYVEYVKEKNIKFTKVLIDGRARKYCAKSIYDMIDDNVIVFIYDFNRLDYQKVLKYYDIVEQLTDYQGVVALKKKKYVIIDNNYY